MRRGLPRASVALLEGLASLLASSASVQFSPLSSSDSSLEETQGSSVLQPEKASDEGVHAGYTTGKQSEEEGDDVRNRASSVGDGNRSDAGSRSSCRRLNSSRCEGRLSSMIDVEFDDDPGNASSSSGPSSTPGITPVGAEDAKGKTDLSKSSRKGKTTREKGRSRPVSFQDDAMDDGGRGVSRRQSYVHDVEGGPARSESFFGRMTSFVFKSGAEGSGEPVVVSGRVTSLGPIGVFAALQQRERYGANGRRKSFLDDVSMLRKHTSLTGAKAKSFSVGDKDVAALVASQIAGGGEARALALPLLKLSTGCSMPPKIWRQSSLESTTLQRVPKIRESGRRESFLDDHSMMKHMLLVGPRPSKNSLNNSLRSGDDDVTGSVGSKGVARRTERWSDGGEATELERRHEETREAMESGDEKWSSRPRSGLVARDAPPLKLSTFEIFDSLIGHTEQEQVQHIQRQRRAQSWVSGHPRGAQSFVLGLTARVHSWGSARRESRMQRKRPGNGRRGSFLDIDAMNFVLYAAREDRDDAVDDDGDAFASKFSTEGGQGDVRKPEGDILEKGAGSTLDLRAVRSPLSSEEMTLSEDDKMRRLSSVPLNLLPADKVYDSPMDEAEQLLQHAVDCNVQLLGPNHEVGFGA